MIRFGNIFDSVFGTGFNGGSGQGGIVNPQMSTREINEMIAALDSQGLTQDQIAQELAELNALLDRNNRQVNSILSNNTNGGDTPFRSTNANNRVATIGNSNFDRGAQTSFQEIINSVYQAREDFANQLRSGEITPEEYAQNMEGLRRETQNVFVESIRNGSIEIGQGLQNAGRNLAASIPNMLSSGLASIGGMARNVGMPMVEGFFSTASGVMGKIAGPLGMAIEAVFDKTLSRMMDQNSAIIQLQRSTGGLITTASLGVDEFGNFTNGMKGSLKSLAEFKTGTGLTMEGFMASLNELASSGGAAKTIGSGGGINQSELVDFGAMSNKMKQQYDTNIAPIVAALRSDLGVSIGESTNMLVDGIREAKTEGLSPNEFAKNMESVIKLSRKLTFKDGVKGMMEMAKVATRLGTTVDSFSTKIVDMKGVTDLFENQQNIAALGLSNLSKDLGQIYAMEKQGMQTEARTTEMSALIKDLKNQGGLTKEGNLNAIGQEIAASLNIGDDKINDLQKLARQSSSTGVDIDKILGKKSMSKEEEKKVQEYEKKNTTFGEKMSKAWDQIQAGLIDPLARVITPIVQFVGDFVEIATPLINVITDFIVYPIELIGDVLGTLGGWLHDLGDGIEWVLDKIGYLNPMNWFDTDGLSGAMQEAIAASQTNQSLTNDQNDLMSRGISIIKSSMNEQDKMNALTELGVSNFKQLDGTMQMFIAKIWRDLLSSQNRKDQGRGFWEAQKQKIDSVGGAGIISEGKKKAADMLSKETAANEKRIREAIKEQSDELKQVQNQQVINVVVENDPYKDIIRSRVSQ